jgi:hypothetical protein
LTCASRCARRDLIELLVCVVVHRGGFRHAALEGEDFVGARHQCLACLFEQVLG